VVGYPHDIKGQALYAYVTLKEGVALSDDIKKELIQHVRKEIGPSPSRTRSNSPKDCPRPAAEKS